MPKPTAVEVNLGEVQRPTVEVLRMSLRVLKGRKVVDLRRYYQDALTGEFKPSPQGISFPAEVWPDIRMMFVRLSKELHEPQA
jgi:Transcriptional Coactivator p15 (PC4)